MSVCLTLATNTLSGQVIATYGGGSGNPSVPNTYLDMVNALFGMGLTISNVSIHCDTAQLQMGWFNGGAATAMPYQEGLVMTSGNIMQVVGPNTQTGATVSLSGPGDADLDSIVGLPTNDRCVIEFDLLPALDTFSVHYIFGSEEYSEFVGTGFNDVFAFLISGPNPSGGNYTLENFALIPGTTLPVAINSVNCTSNASYYVCNIAQDSTICSACPVNDSITALQYDGLTVDLDAYIPVVPLQTYHVKLAIADVSDGILDSGVFLQGGGISCRGQGPQSVAFNPQAGTSLKSFPNPSEGILNIQMNFKQQTKANLSLTDIFGKTIAVIQEGEMTAGTHTLSYDASALPKGCYLLTLTTEKGSSVQKCVLY